MVPTTVLMNAEILAAGLPAGTGSILGPQGTGWSNLSSEYYTKGTNQGLPVPFSFSVHSFGSPATGVPQFAQPPARAFTSPYGSFLFPRADSPTAPDIGGLS